MSMSTATSWSSSRETAEAETETARTESDMHEIPKGDAPDIAPWLKPSSETTSVVDSKYQPKEPLDAAKLSRIAQVFGVAPRVGGVRGDRSISSSSSATGSGMRNGGRNGFSHASSRSVTLGGGLRTLAMVEAKNERSFSTGHGELASPANSVFSRSSSTYTTNTRRNNSSQDLITVLPPDHLLIPSIIPHIPTDEGVAESDSATSLDARQAQKELQRWRRGRMLPFRSSLRDMINVIVREWGLPSPVGVEVYLVSLNGGEDLGHEDLEGGSLIGQEAWSILVGRVGSQRVPTPWNADRKLSAPSPLGRSIPLINGVQTSSFTPINNRGFLTPTSSTFGLSQTLESPPSRSAASSPGKVIDRDDARKRQADLGQGFPSATGTTARSDSSIVVGKIEFDIDRRKAVWYDLWNQRRRESAERGRADGGMRRLMLGEKREELAEETIIKRGDDSDSDQAKEMEIEYAQLADEEEADPLADVFPTDEDEFAALKQSRVVNGHAADFGIKDIGTDSILNEYANLDTPGAADVDSHDDVEEVMQMLRHKTGQMLASPIEIASPAMGALRDARTTEQPGTHGLGVGMFDDVDKRGSGMVMSDRLNDLEEVLRGLHPQELQFEQATARTSSLAASAAGGSRNPDLKGHVSPELKAGSRKLPSTIAKLDDLAGLSSSHQSTSQPPPAAAWPAIPFIRTPDATPILPSTFQDDLRQPAKYTPRSAPDGSSPIPLSPETMMRMEYDHLPAPRSSAAAAWRPQRPARPPNPSLATMISLSRSLPNDVDVVLPQRPSNVSVPPPPTPAFGIVEEEKRPGPEPQLKNFLGQKSVPKLAKLFHRDNVSSAVDSQAMAMEDGDDESPRSRGRRPSIWNKHGESSSNLSISAPLSPQEMSEFENLVETLPPKETTATKKNRRSFGKRLFKAPFGSGHGNRQESPIIEPEAKIANRITSQPASPAVPQSPGSESQADRPLSLTTSPRSPTSVRRKPVPRDGEMVNSPSLGESIASFVLEQAPVGQRRLRE